MKYYGKHSRYVPTDKAQEGRGADQNEEETYTEVQTLAIQNKVLAIHTLNCASIEWSPLCIYIYIYIYDRRKSKNM